MWVIGYDDIASGSLVVRNKAWTPPKNWQGPAAGKGVWKGDVGNSQFALSDDVAEAVGVPKGTSINFVEGSPDFSPFVKPTPAGTSGSFPVEGLVFEHAKDARTIVKQLVQESGMTQKAVRKWLVQQDVSTSKGVRSSILFYLTITK